MNGEQDFLYFDTGLSSRAFAQAKFGQVIAEHGFIVRPDTGSVELWKASGVIERGTMVMWGPAFEGERLDFLLNECEQRDKVLAAISLWIQAILTVKDVSHITAPLWPCAAIIGKDEVFFAPPSLARRMMATDAQFSGGEWYVNIGLDDMAAAAFTAAAMLYHVLAGTPPFPAVDEILLHQDMRDSNFLPLRFAVPGLDERLAALIQNTLAPLPQKTGVRGMAGEEVLGEFLAILSGEQAASPVSCKALIQPLAEPDRLLLEKEKAQFLKVHTASVKTRRFVARNTAILIGCLAGIVIAALIAHNVITTRAGLPTTAGMDPLQVIASYYGAFGELDHQMMEACVIRGAGKDDITMIINFFVINKVRQAYEFDMSPSVISAEKWQEGGGGPVNRMVFGVTDLRIEQIAMVDEAAPGRRPPAASIHYRVDYILWAPVQEYDDAESSWYETLEEPMPQPYPRSDILTLAQRKGNWRISELQRQ